LRVIRDATARQYARFIACGRSRLHPRRLWRICNGGRRHAPEVQVQGELESATGPVTGYRARVPPRSPRAPPSRSAARERVPGQLMKDQAMQGMATCFRYVPGALTHRAKATATRSSCAGNRPRPRIFSSTALRDDAQIFRDLYNWSARSAQGPGGMIFGRGGARRELVFARRPSRRFGTRRRPTSRRPRPRSSMAAGPLSTLTRSRL